jgi:hypothetical protein
MYTHPFRAISSHPKRFRSSVIRDVLLSTNSARPAQGGSELMERLAAPFEDDERNGCELCYFRRCAIALSQFYDTLRQLSGRRTRRLNSTAPMPRPLQSSIISPHPVSSSTVYSDGPIGAQSHDRSRTCVYAWISLTTEAAARQCALQLPQTISHSFWARKVCA